MRDGEYNRATVGKGRVGLGGQVATETAHGLVCGSRRSDRALVGKFLKNLRNRNVHWPLEAPLRIAHAWVIPLDLILGFGPTGGGDPVRWGVPPARKSF